MAEPQDKNEPNTQPKSGTDAEAGQVDDFDPERALKTIRHQRQVEKELKARIRDLETANARLSEQEPKSGSDRQKLEDQLRERDQRIATLEAKVQTEAVKTDFIREATSRGINDPNLAYLAAQAQGAIGSYDPETGTVGEHDFDKLEQSHPLLVSGSPTGAGNPGVRGRRPGVDAATQFNRAIRQSMHGT